MQRKLVKMLDKFSLHKENIGQGWRRSAAKRARGRSSLTLLGYEPPSVVLISHNT